MGHLCIVNEATEQAIIREGYLSTHGGLGKYWIKTVADLFSDLLAMRPDDYVFPWITAGTGGANLGFRHVLRVDGPPIFCPGEEYPLKVPLKATGEKFATPLPEVDALDLFGAFNGQMLWNAIGKKSLGRGRSVTHQTPMEDELLLNRLKALNGGISTPVTLTRVSFPGAVPINIVPTQNLPGSCPPSLLLKDITVSGMQWSSGSCFTYEKVQEAWLMEHIDDKLTDAFWDLALPGGLKGWKLEWFANYLPFGVQGSNIDVVALHSSCSKPGERLVTIIELKVGQESQSGFKWAAEEVAGYCGLISNAFKAFRVPVSINPVVLTGASKPRGGYKAVTTSSGYTPKWINYEIDTSGYVNFKQVP